MNSLLRVLIVEDSQFDAELAVEYLAHLPFAIEAIVVDNEREFVSHISRGNIDIVISDFSLPGFSGSEALAIARRVVPDLPFIFLSGVLGEEHAVDMLKRGATDYLVKSRLVRLPIVVERAIKEAEERRQRIEAERALRESEYLFSRIIESLRDYAVILLGPDGHIRTWNGASQAMFGYVLEEVRGRSADFLFVEADRLAGAFEQELALAAREGSASDDRWLQQRDGKLIYASGVTTLLTDENGRIQGFSKIVRDMTEAHTAAQAMEAARIVAEDANQAKNRFLAVLSHELRTPLTPILAAAHVLERNPQMPAEMVHLTTMIRRNIALEARLIDDLLDLTSIERDKLVLRTAALDTHAALRSAIDMLSEDIAHKQISLATELTALRTRMEGDEARIQQIFWNLLRNAVKFTHMGGRIHVQSSNPSDDRIRVSVTDTGIGIDKSALSRIFTQFEQADPTIPKTFGGLGLGLAIALALTTRHGGTLVADSDGPGKGATFTLELPVCPSATSAPLPDQTTEPQPSTVGDVPHILLVEDNRDAAEALQVALEMSGDYRVTTASSARQAIGLLRSQPFDLLICDIGLPDGNGLDVVAAADRDLPAIALSGYGMSADTARSLRAGFDAHLVKPLEQADLEREIRRALARGSA
ncbi:MAG: response regulator [Rhodocyclaceae bacterium]